MIKCDNVSIKYHDKRVLDNINLVFEDGLHYLLHGKSGLGKTSLLHAILGLIDYQGTITKSSNNISMIFQENRLLSHSDVFTNLKFVQPKDCDNKSYEAKIDHVLMQLDLLDYKYSPISKLSGGMKRRVAIARALLVEGDLLIADEPFKGLDSVLCDKVLSLFNTYYGDKTIILVSHQPITNFDYIDVNLIGSINRNN